MVTASGLLQPGGLKDGGASQHTRPRCRGGGDVGDLDPTGWSVATLPGMFQQPKSEALEAPEGNKENKQNTPSKSTKVAW